MFESFDNYTIFYSLRFYFFFFQYIQIYIKMDDYNKILSPLSILI